MMKLSLLAHLTAATVVLSAGATHAEEKSELSIGMVYVAATRCMPMLNLRLL